MNVYHFPLFRFIGGVQRDCWNSFWQVEKKVCNSAEANQDVPQFSKLNFPQETKDKDTNTNLFTQDQARFKSSVVKMISGRCLWLPTSNF